MAIHPGRVSLNKKIKDLKLYVNQYLKSRNECTIALTRDLMWSRVGLCYMVFKELELMDEAQLEEFFCSKD